MKARLERVRFGPREWTGAFGDLGTFVPLFLGLVVLNGLPPARTLFVFGLVYIAAALYFRIPLPVQPLKAVSAIAIAKGLGMDMIAAAGLWMGAILLLLNYTGGITWLTRYFTRPIVKGIQLGVGLMLIKTSFKLFTSTSYPEFSGAAAGLAALPDPSVFLAALWVMVLPQIPLTLGNAIFASADLSREYFGEKAARAKPRSLAVSMGLSDLAAGFFGVLPMCHGSGGLTAHYRFGARTAGATIITGALFILLAAVFGDRTYHVLTFVPPWVYGLMVLYVGGCQGWLIFSLKERRVLGWLMGLVGLGTGNLAYALAFGLVAEEVIRRRRGSRG